MPDQICDVKVDAFASGGESNKRESVAKMKNLLTLDALRSRKSAPGSRRRATCSVTSSSSSWEALEAPWGVSWPPSPLGPSVGGTLLPAMAAFVESGCVSISLLSFVTVGGGVGDLELNKGG